MTIQEQLDQLADYQAQIDVLNMDKQALLDAVKIPAEVQSVQDESIKRKRAIDAEYQSKQTELMHQKQSLLATVVVPPEIKAAFEAIENQRAEIEREFNRKNAEAWGEAVRKKELIDRELTDSVAEVYAQVETRKVEINAEFSGKVEAANANIAKLTAQVKAEVVKAGQTVKGAFLQAVYTKGRVTWTTDTLDGVYFTLNKIMEMLEAAVSEQREIPNVYGELRDIAKSLAKARKVGDPSVAIRKIG
jgi:hypothetical protein